MQVLQEESSLSTACWCVEQTAGAQRRAGWALAADELTPGSEAEKYGERVSRPCPSGAGLLKASQVSACCASTQEVGTTEGAASLACLFGGGVGVLVTV